MAGSVNKVIIIGHLGRDPEVKTMSNGGKVVNLSVATSERWKDRNSGENKEKTEWHRVVIWNEHLSEIAERYLRKGSQVYLEGALQTRKWAGENGVEKYSTEVILSRFKGELRILNSTKNGDDELTQPPPMASSSGGAAGGKRGSIPDLDDEIPF